MMFEKCSIMVLCADEQQSVRRIEIDTDTQESICQLFSDAAAELTNDKEKVEFDGRYKPDQDEILCISNFQLSDDIKDAIRDPLGVSAYEKVNGDYPAIKAVFIGARTEDDETEKFVVAFQRFRKEQYISAHNINLFWSKNSFRREKEFGLSISDSIDCCFSDEDLLFTSFFFARQVFDLSGYYRSATTQEVTDFSSNEILNIEDTNAFEAMANTSIRRKIAMINDSGVLQSFSAAEIKRLAQKAGIDLTVKNKQISIPNDKEQIKIILGFLDEEAYKGPFSQVTYLANSKRKVQTK
ncbi:MAG: hypothetical protein DBY24_02730 [Prevotellaceae bacterium]|nr:MAG: hypothetical protein DBY24_02730 [Prevotellaceae bacterium]